MRAPDFWGRPASRRALLLEPLGRLYGFAGRLERALRHPARLPVPVISVGNLVAGGAGKTPVAIALAERLRSRGVGAHLLSRGYGGREAGPLKIDPERHEAADVGDEPLLLARTAPTWIARDRLAGARAALAAGAELLILDDGHQNRALEKDLALVVIDAGYGFGNGKVMPAGPLREPVAQGLARADAVVLLGEDRKGLAARLPRALPTLRARLQPEARAARDLAGQDVVAFAGIGRPEKFFETLEALGARVVGRHAFADHHPYGTAEIEALLAEGRQRRAELVTTEKDALRLPPTLRGLVRTLPVAIAWNDESALDALLAPLVEKITAA